MPKRMPGGRVKRTGNKDRRRGALPQPAEHATSPAASRPAPLPTARPAATAAPRQSLLAGVRRPARSSAPPLTTDYSYVYSDLKRIGIVGGGAFALLVALTFVIR